MKAGKAEEWDEAGAAGACRGQWRCSGGTVAFRTVCQCERPVLIWILTFKSLIKCSALDYFLKPWQSQTDWTVFFTGPNTAVVWRVVTWGEHPTYKFTEESARRREVVFLCTCECAWCTRVGVKDRDDAGGET